MNSTMLERGIRFALDEASGVPFYRQIIRQIETAVLARKLEPGDKLPTIRALAIELKINPNTIAKAYSELELRGIVVTQVGSGTYVSDRRVEAEALEREKCIEETVARYVRSLTDMGIDRDAMIQLVRDFKEA
jgi:GntR family transcriptional regulator